MTTDEIQIIENFINNENQGVLVMKMDEMRAIVKMQYELYRYLMMPTYHINIDVEKHSKWR